MKFARNVHFNVKNGKVADFNRLVEKDVLPLLKQQNGFLQALTLEAQNGVVGISVWKDRAAADAYTSGVFPKVLEKLAPVLEGQPSVRTYDVGLTTLSA